MKVEQYLQDVFGLSPDEKLICDFACFHDASLLQPAHIYLTKNHICMHLHGQGKDLVIPWKSITALTKKNTALIIPSAIDISVEHAPSIFLSFLNRHHAYKVIHEAWTGKPSKQDSRDSHDSHSEKLLLDPEEVIVSKESIETHYTFKKELGSGAFSVVKLAKHNQTGEMRAVKAIEKALVKEKKERLDAEVEILKRVQHPHIISLREIYETEDFLYLVMELATGGELFDAITKRGHYKEKDSAKIIRQIAEAVAYLHLKGIVHRDLKPENLLLASKSPSAPVKLADFGLSKTLQETKILQTACGTPGYVAPEVLKGEGYGKEVDIWSLGVIMYILLCGFPPFSGDNNNILFEKIMSGKYSFPLPYWAKVSSGAKDLISKMLVVNPSHRLTAVEVLEHSWIQGTVGDSDLTDILKQLRKTRESESQLSGFTTTKGSIARMAVNSFDDK